YLCICPSPGHFRDTRARLTRQTHSGETPGHSGGSMARSARLSILETRSARLKLPIAKKPVFFKIGPGIGPGYRRNQSAGTWVVRVSNGAGGNWTKAIGIADDFDEADGSHVLTYWQAQEKARAIARSDNGRDTGKPVTVAEAINAYEHDLRM